MRTGILTAAVSGICLLMSPPGLAHGAGFTKSGCPSPQSGSMHATVPAALAALEEKQRQLKASSLRFSIRSELETQGSKIDLTESGRSRSTPPETAVRIDARVRNSTGHRVDEVTRELEIGDTRYSYDPSLTKGDGGRPWTREHLSHKQLEEQRISKPTGAEGLFTSLSGPLSQAQSIEEAGQKTVDGRTVEQFNLVFAPGEYPSKELAFGSLFEEEFCNPTIDVALSIEPSGLPLLTTVSASYRNSKRTVNSTTSLEVPAINLPFARLKPPPAKRIITAAALRKFESERLRKRLGKLKKTHRNH